MSATPRSRQRLRRCCQASQYVGPGAIHARRHKQSRRHSICGPSQRCLVAPSPQLRERILERLRGISETRGSAWGPRRHPATEAPRLQRWVDHSWNGVSARHSDLTSAARPPPGPLRGAVRVIVVLVDFTTLDTALPVTSTICSSRRQDPDGQRARVLHEASTDADVTARSSGYAPPTLAV